MRHLDRRPTGLIESHAIVAMLREIERREAKRRERMARFGVAFRVRVLLPQEPDGPALAPASARGQ